jgi:hypothetical protein
MQSQPTVCWQPGCGLTCPTVRSNELLERMLPPNETALAISRPCDEAVNDGDDAENYHEDAETANVICISLR